MSGTIQQIRKRIENLHAIPANEQYFGHFQFAMQSICRDLLDHVEKLEKLEKRGERDEHP